MPVLCDILRTIAGNYIRFLRNIACACVSSSSSVPVADRKVALGVDVYIALKYCDEYVYCRPMVRGINQTRPRDQKMPIIIVMRVQLNKLSRVHKLTCLIGLEKATRDANCAEESHPIYVAFLFLADQ
jgi:hypothetical protein